jgi:hypothetical protein
MAKSPVVYGLMASSGGVDVIHGKQKRVINAMEEPNLAFLTPLRESPPARSGVPFLHSAEQQQNGPMRG